MSSFNNHVMPFISLLSFPLFCSHKLQMLDRSMYELSKRKLTLFVMLKNAQMKNTYDKL